MKKGASIWVCLAMMVAAVFPVLAEDQDGGLVGFKSNNRTCEAVWQNPCGCGDGQDNPILAVSCEGENRGMFEFQGMDISVQKASDFFGLNHDGLVVSVDSGGSGGYIDWQILKEEKGQFKSIFAKKEIFQGQIRISGRLIQEWRSSQCRQYRWNGAEIISVSKPQKEAYSPGTKVVHYTINRQGEISSKDLKIQPVQDSSGYQANVTMEKGQKIVLNRVGSGPVDRIMFDDSSSVLMPAAEPMAWIASGRGEFAIFIIPNGYDWELALRINVHIE